jgi:hypothetical protein
MAIELRQAPLQEVQNYLVWFREEHKKQALPYAIFLYNMGEMKGERPIEGCPSVPFTASWRVTSLPMDTNVCKVTFETPEDMTYEVQLVNHEFVNYLIEVTRIILTKGTPDFPQSFYSKLFRIKLKE